MIAVKILLISDLFFIFYFMLTPQLTGRPCTGAQSVNTENVPNPEIAGNFHTDPVPRIVADLICSFHISVFFSVSILLFSLSKE